MSLHFNQKIRNNEAQSENRESISAEVHAKKRHFEHLQTLIEQSKKINEEQQELLREIKRALDVLNNYGKLPTIVQNKLLEVVRQPNNFGVQKVSALAQTKGELTSFLREYDRLYSGNQLLNKQYGLTGKDCKNIKESLFKEYDKLLKEESDERLYQRLSPILEKSDTLLRQYDNFRTGYLSTNLSDIRSRRNEILGNLRQKREAATANLVKEIKNLLSQDYEIMDNDELQVFVSELGLMVDKIDDTEFNLDDISKYTQKIQIADTDNNYTADRLEEDGHYWSTLKTLKTDVLNILRFVEEKLKSGQ